MALGVFIRSNCLDRRFCAAGPDALGSMGVDDQRGQAVVRSVVPRCQAGRPRGRWGFVPQMLQGEEISPGADNAEAQRGSVQDAISLSAHRLARCTRRSSRTPRKELAANPRTKGFGADPAGPRQEPLPFRLRFAQSDHRCAGPWGLEKKEGARGLVTGA